MHRSIVSTSAVVDVMATLSVALFYSRKRYDKRARTSVRMIFPNRQVVRAKYEPYLLATLQSARWIVRPTFAFLSPPYTRQPEPSDAYRISWRKGGRESCKSGSANTLAWRKSAKLWGTNFAETLHKTGRIISLRGGARINFASKCTLCEKSKREVVTRRDVHRRQRRW